MRAELQTGLAHVGAALREPEEFAQRWQCGAAHYSPWVWGALLGTAIFGTTTYGRPWACSAEFRTFCKKA
jgi:hypothetical protein